MEFNHDNLLTKIFLYRNDRVTINIFKLRKLANIKYANIRKYLFNRYDDVVFAKQYTDIDYFKATIIRMKYKINKAPLCPTCGKPIPLKRYGLTFFTTYCSYKCSNSDENKVKQYEEYCMKKFGVKCACQQREKVKQTCIKRYGTPYPLNNPIIQEKRQATLKKHNTFNTSKAEENIYKLLTHIYGKNDVLRQYKCNRYPWHCDFYILSKDLFIELQGYYTHGKHPFNPNNNEDIKRLNKLKEKYQTGQHPQYKNAIITWTKGDVLKRNKAKDNNLNYIEIFNYKDLENVKSKLLEYHGQYMVI